MRLVRCLRWSLQLPVSTPILFLFNNLQEVWLTANNMWVRLDCSYIAGSIAIVLTSCTGGPNNFLWQSTLMVNGTYACGHYCCGDRPTTYSHKTCICLRKIWESRWIITLGNLYPFGMNLRVDFLRSQLDDYEWTKWNPTCLTDTKATGLSQE